MIQIRNLQAKPEVERERRPRTVFTTKLMPQKKKSAEETWDWLVRKGLLDDNTIERRNYQHINNAWVGEPCYIVASGPPLKDVLDAVGWDFFRNRHTIGINHTIEDFDEFEWFIFLDQRFLDNTTYDLKKFRGRIFAQCTTNMKTSKNVTVFHCSRQPTDQIEMGLYKGTMTGLVALNLAIISGANPIYLLGYGMGSGATHEAYHYKADYTAESKNPERIKKFRRVLRHQFSAFSYARDRIIHVTPGDDVPGFRKMRVPEFAKRHEGKPPSKRPRIVHLSFTADVQRHSEVTRHVLSDCVGSHAVVDINSPIPPADLYVYEHFLKTDRPGRNLSQEIKEKTIAIVHTKGCYPDGFSRVVSLTAAWQRVLSMKGIDSTLVRGGIDLTKFQGVEPDYEARVFGRMTRWSPGKIHRDWNRTTLDIFDAVEGSSCLFFVDRVNQGGRPKLNHPRMTYSDECKIYMDKAPFLRRMSVYVHASGGFQETMSIACVEALACGLPVVYLTEWTGVLEEVVGSGGIRCRSIQEVEQAVVSLLRDPQKCRLIGARAREQAKKWSRARMVNEFNELFLEEWRRKK